MFRSKQNFRDLRELIDVIPAQFLRHKSSHASQSAKLWQLSRVSKRVWKPKGIAPLPKSTLKISLPQDELSGKRFTRRHISVMLNPRTANVLESAVLNVILHTLKSRWVECLEPFVLLGGGGGKVVLGVLVDEIALSHPGADYFALRFCEWPEPTRIYENY